MKRFLALKSLNVILITASAMFMAQLDSSVLVIALPQIAEDFDLPIVSLSLAISIYLTMIVAMLPISGWAADRYGAKRIFLAAIAGFALFSLGCALSTGFTSFIVFRALQGASAALMLPVGRLILLRNTSKDELVDALSITTMPMLIAPTFGPAIGGFIVDFATWHYIFLLNLPISIILFAVAWSRLPQMDANPELPLDAVGAILLSAGMIAALTGLDRLVGGLAAPLPWILIVAGVGLFIPGIRHIRSHKSPIISLDALRSQAFRTATIGAGAIARLPGRALIFALPLMFQVGFGLSPFIAGLLFIALNGGDLVSKPWINPLFERFGYRETVTVGAVLGVLSLAVFVVVERGPWLVPILVTTLFAAGVSRSLVFTGITSLTFATLDKATLTSGNVLASISMQLFNALAVSMTAVILSLFARYHGYSEPAVADYRLTLAAIAVLALASAIALYRRAPRSLEEVHPAEGS